MTDLDTSILNDWKDIFESKTNAKLCEHLSDTETIDYDYGIEYCCYCGALGRYDIDKDKLEWTLPQHLSGRA